MDNTDVIAVLGSARETKQNLEAAIATKTNPYDDVTSAGLGEVYNITCLRSATVMRQVTQAVTPDQSTCVFR